MKASISASERLKYFAPQIEKTSLSTKVWIVILLMFIAAGGVALYQQIAIGHVVTGMRDNVIWGLYIANFIFFIGISYAGAILSGVLYVFKVPWRRPIVRIAGLVTIAAGLIGPVFILLCIGRFDRMHHLFLYPRLQSPITWDVMAICTYLVGAVLYLYLTLIRDFSLYSDADFLNIPNWKRKLYKTLSLGYKGTGVQKKQLKSATRLLAIVMIPLVVIISSVLSWIFGMTLRPGWHSSIFGPYFVIASILTGVGVIIIIMWTFRRLYNLKEYLTDKHFTYMGFIMLVLAAGYGYFSFSEYLTGWYGSEKWDSEVLSKLFNTNEYGWWFLFSNIFAIVLPILVVALPKLRKPGPIAFSALLMVFAMWVKRYLIVVPTLETPLLPVQDTRMEYVHYAATWQEWALTFAGIATFLLIFIISSKLVTIVPTSDYIDDEKA
ncbi:MAG: polysulfide reductase NrfD [Saprospiraceae bacterium]|nr:polysulfide reductase NrfD [Saprospiraceae bacterium]MCF8251966.1 polysulfide reductase NrfD [Saprospiraceae bacterium]MCF8282775.1 polysulfide reductase NrfD [Bacteroidales bacterium]MCF8313630.1 polysulfide reductase NrfD [Saprospiraceae bacterium]MCF8442337.1 polysulfide reductase NrfD [Saprospiraceae bacterium]